MRTFSLLSIFITVSLFSSAQVKDTITVLPGHPLLKTEHLLAHTRHYDFFKIEHGIEKKIGKLDARFIVGRNGKEETGLFICSIEFGANSILDSGLFYLRGLRPIYHRSKQTAKLMRLEFDGQQINGRLTSFHEGGGEVKMISHASPVPLFDSYYEDLIAQSIELKKGLIFKFPEYIYERGGTVWSTGEVVRGAVQKNSKGEWDKIWTICFYERNAIGEVTRTTTYQVEESTHQIIFREYKIGDTKIVMKLRS